MTDLTLDTVLVQQREDVAPTLLDAQVVCLHIEQGRFYGLNVTGSRIFTLLEQPMPVADLLRALAAEYEVPEATAEADVLEFLGALLANGLIRRVEPAEPTDPPRSNG